MNVSPRKINRLEVDFSFRKQNTVESQTSQTPAHNRCRIPNGRAVDLLLLWKPGVERKGSK